MSNGIFSRSNRNRSAIDSKLNALSAVLHDLEQRRQLDRPAKHLLLKTVNQLIAHAGADDRCSQALRDGLDALHQHISNLPVGQRTRGSQWTALRRAHSHCLELLSSSSSPHPG